MHAMPNLSLNPGRAGKKTCLGGMGAPGDQGHMMEMAEIHDFPTKLCTENHAMQNSKVKVP
jgi:hypothetical protein